MSTESNKTDIMWIIAGGFGSLVLGGGIFAYGNYKENTNFAIDSNFEVGKYTATYSGWRKVTLNDLKKNPFQIDLLEAHQKNRGWPFLENFIPHGCLHADNGMMSINDYKVYMKGYNFLFNKQISDMKKTYQAKSVNIKPNAVSSADWLEESPRISDKWTIIDTSNGKKDENVACLFVKDDNAPEQNPKSNLVHEYVTSPGGKKTRRRKSKKSKNKNHKH